jgi:hypothetical protein
MTQAAKSIETHEDLKRHTAALGVVLSGLAIGQPAPDQEQYLNIGLQICSILSQLEKHQGGDASQGTFEEAAFLQRFCQESERVMRHPDRLPELRQKAVAAHATFERLLHLETVSADEIKNSTRFCHSVYAAF